jgi:hypothetical protein
MGAARNNFELIHQLMHQLPRLLRLRLRVGLIGCRYRMAGIRGHHGLPCANQDGFNLKHLLIGASQKRLGLVGRRWPQQHAEQGLLGLGTQGKRQAIGRLQVSIAIGGHKDWPAVTITRQDCFS